MNPVDHPLGGRTRGNRHPVSPWGQPAKGMKTRKNKRTDAMIVRTDTVRGGIDRALLESIAEDDAVRTVTPRLELLTRLPEPKRAATAPATNPGVQPPSMMTPGMQSAQVVGIRLPHDAPATTKARGPRAIALRPLPACV